MFDVPEDEVEPPTRIAVPVPEVPAHRAVAREPSDAVPVAVPAAVPVPVDDFVEGWPSASRRVRPKTISRAGGVLIAVGAIGLLVWLFLLALGYAIASALADPSNGGAGLHIRPVGYVIIAVPIGFCVVQTVSGAWVLRGAAVWARVLAIVTSCLAVTASAAVLFAGAVSIGRLVLLLVPVVVYAGVNLWLVVALINAETRRWCQRAR